MTISMKINQAAVEIWKHHPVPGEDFKKRPKKGKNVGRGRTEEERKGGIEGEKARAT